MSQKMYNLTDNVEDGFKFDIHGKVFFMRYPNTEEIEELQKMADESRGSDKGVDFEQNKRAQEYMYQFITPVDHDMPVREALKTANLKVLQRFNTMVKTEFSTGE